MVPLPQLFWPQLNSYAISVTRILAQTTVSLPLLKPLPPSCRPTDPCQLSAFVCLPTSSGTWGQHLQWKNIVYFSHPMLSWWVWNVCLGMILRGVWKNNRAVNTEGRPRLASLFQMWSRLTLLAQLQSRHCCNPIHCHYCPTACPSAGLSASVWTGYCVILQCSDWEWAMCVQRPQSELVPNAHLSRNQTTEEGYKKKINPV